MHPRAHALNVLKTVPDSICGKRLTLHLQVGNGFNILCRDVPITNRDNRALRIRERNDGGAELDAFQCGVLGNVARPRDGNALTGPSSGACILEHVPDVVDEAIASGLRADQTAAPVQTFAG
jgi:hypothetical protein